MEQASVIEDQAAAHAAANLPPIFHPFAIQTAAWIHNRLPRPSRGNETPYYVLTRSLPSLAMLYCFGCLAAVVIPVPRREGDRHFADRGEHAIYLGPSEVSPGHVVYLLSSRRITTVAKIHPWEDQFPGIAGERGHRQGAESKVRQATPERPDRKQAWATRQSRMRRSLTAMASPTLSVRPSVRLVTREPR